MSSPRSINVGFSPVRWAELTGIARAIFDERDGDAPAQHTAYSFVFCNMHCQLRSSVMHRELALRNRAGGFITFVEIGSLCTAASGVLQAIEPAAAAFSPHTLVDDLPRIGHARMLAAIER